ncbi:hypothetical protein ACJX0J_024551, partial [Zea mays]
FWNFCTIANFFGRMFFMCRVEAWMAYYYDQIIRIEGGIQEPEFLGMFLPTILAG